jgi:hypothetical protein
MAEINDSYRSASSAILQRTHAYENVIESARRGQSKEMLELILEEGGIAPSEQAFTVAMHGWTRHSRQTEEGFRLAKQYGDLSDRFTKAYGQPVAEIGECYQFSSCLGLKAIGFASQWYGDSTLRYRVWKSGEGGSIELPVGPARSYVYEAVGKVAVETKETDHFVVARVKRTAGVYDPAERNVSVEVTPNLYIGYAAIMATGEQNASYPLVEKEFYDQIEDARQLFDLVYSPRHRVAAD